MLDLIPGIAAKRRLWWRAWLDDPRSRDLRHGRGAGQGVALAVLLSLPGWFALGMLLVRRFG